MGCGKTTMKVTNSPPDMLEPIIYSWGVPFNSYHHNLREFLLLRQDLLSNFPSKKSEIGLMLSFKERKEKIIETFKKEGKESFLSEIFTFKKKLMETELSILAVNFMETPKRPSNKKKGDQISATMECMLVLFDFLLTLVETKSIDTETGIDSWYKVFKKEMDGVPQKFIRTDDWLGYQFKFHNQTFLVRFPIPGILDTTFPNSLLFLCAEYISDPRATVYTSISTIMRPFDFHLVDFHLHEKSQLIKIKMICLVEKRVGFCIELDRKTSAIGGLKKMNTDSLKKKLKYADSVSELEEEILDDSDSEMRKGMMILRMDDENKMKEDSQQIKMNNGQKTKLNNMSGQKSEVVDGFEGRMFHQFTEFKRDSEEAEIPIILPSMQNDYIITLMVSEKVDIQMDSELKPISESLSPTKFFSKYKPIIGFRHSTDHSVHSLPMRHPRMHRHGGDFHLLKPINGQFPLDYPIRFKLLSHTSIRILMMETVLVELTNSELRYIEFTVKTIIYPLPSAQSTFQRWVQLRSGSKKVTILGQSKIWYGYDLFASYFVSGRVDAEEFKRLVECSMIEEKSQNSKQEKAIFEEIKSEISPLEEDVSSWADIEVRIESVICCQKLNDHKGKGEPGHCFDCLLLRAKVIYDWICANIVYSKSDYKDGSVENPIEVMNKKKTVCRGFSSLYHYLGLKAGLDVHIVDGFARQSWSRKEAERISLNNELAVANHQWNVVVFPQNKAFIVDCTFGASQKNPIMRRSYFMGDPRKFCFTHFPEDKIYSLWDKYYLDLAELIERPVVLSQLVFNSDSLLFKSKVERQGAKEFVIEMYGMSSEIDFLVVLDGQTQDQTRKRIRVESKWSKVPQKQIPVVINPYDYIGNLDQKSCATRSITSIYRHKIVITDLEESLESEIGHSNTSPSMTVYVSKSYLSQYPPSLIASQFPNTPTTLTRNQSRLPFGNPYQSTHSEPSDNASFTPLAIYPPLSLIKLLK